MTLWTTPASTPIPFKFPKKRIRLTKKQRKELELQIAKLQKPYTQRVISAETLYSVLP